MISNRIQIVFPKLINASQISFAPNRHITDNIVFVQELVHSMRKKTGGKFMALKIDLQKAYDKLR